jgi:hypothetical protein
MGILAAMSNLALLARDAAAPPFNADFYVTVATVTPVLFLAAAVQIRGYEAILKAFAKAASQFPRWAHGIRPGVTPVKASGLLAFLTSPFVLGMLPLVPVLILLAGGYGEYLAISALYQGHDSLVMRKAVLTYTTILLIAVLAGPVATFIRITASTMSDVLRAYLSPARDAQAVEPDTAEAGPPKKSKADTKG